MSKITIEKCKKRTTDDINIGSALKALNIYL
jgi:hypothetical protein